MTWAEKHSVRLEHIQPGKPQQNAYIQRDNRTFRDEWLSQYIFETIEEAQNQATYDLVAWTSSPLISAAGCFLEDALDAAQIQR
jgi:transposase InsO family protein